MIKNKSAKIIWCSYCLETQPLILAKILDFIMLSCALSLNGNKKKAPQKRDLKT